MKTNMKSIRYVLAGMVLAGGALLAVATGFSPASAADGASAATPGAPGERHHGFGPEHVFSKLGLTAEQKASIKSIVTAARPQMQTLHGQMQANHLKLIQTKPDDPNYANVVAAVAQSNATLASQRTTQAAELRSQMYAVLTPAQKAELATLEAQEAAHPHHGHGGPHGSGDQ
jgi:Spy/CpxP family protein refolding chaperone